MGKKISLGLCLSALLLASGCADSTSTGECATGTFKCDDNKLQVCDNAGTWVLSQTCGVAETCSSTLGRCIRNNDVITGDCTEGQYKCEGKALYACDSTQKWSLSKTCGTQETCNATKKDCDKNDVQDTCQSGMFRCDDKALYACDSTQKWSFSQTCGTQETCSEAQGRCVSQVVPCTSADYCENNAVISCSTGTKQTTPCVDQICMMRGTTAACEPVVCTEGTVECKDGNTKRTCRQNAWVEESCGSGNVCSDKQKDCVVHVCDDNAKRCNNNAVETCDNNTWKITNPCGSESMCDTGTKSCVAINCNDGDMRCNDGKLEQCQDNAFSIADSCTGKICKETSDTTASCIEKVCTDGTYQCLSTGELQKCIDNAWKKSLDCGDVNLCDASKGQCYACVSGKKCDGKTLMSCVNHTWTTLATCDTASRCDPAKDQCDVCDGSEIKCSGKDLMECRDGQWNVKASCEEADLCDASNGVCKPKVVVEKECEGSGYQCKDNVLQQCVSEHWATKETCVTGTTCNASKKQCDECTGSTEKCADDKHYVCSSGKWTLKACDASTQFCNTATNKCDTIECGDDGLYCKDTKLMQCTSHKATQVEDCGLSTLCTEIEDVAGEVTYGCKRPTWCNIQWIDEGIDQVYSRILIESPLETSDVKARLACGSIDKAVSTWRSVNAIQGPCSTCDVNTEYHSYSFDGDAGNYQCTFIFDIGADSYACLPKIELDDTVNLLEGTPYLMDSNTKLTEKQTFALEVSAYNEAHTPSWCNLRYVDASNKKIYSDIYMGKASAYNQMSPALVDPVVYCTNKNPKTMLTTEDWKQIPAYQNLLFYEYDNPNLQFMADLSELTGHWECAFTYQFGDERFVCPTIRDNYDEYPYRNISAFTLVEGYYWGADYE